jgi:hypothetical protein
LYEDSGTLAKIDGRVMFFSDDGRMVDVECDQFNFITVLGEIGLSETQALLDKLHGGAVGIALTRQQEVQ